MVIIDTAPLLAASVTRELVTMADVVVLVSRAGRTTSPAAERTAELLERLGAPTLGVVLVGVPTGVFKNDYYTKPQSRTDRFRASVRGRSESGAGRDTVREADHDAPTLTRPRPRRRTRRRRGRLRPARVVRTTSVEGHAAMSPRRRRSGP